MFYGKRDYYEVLGVQRGQVRRNKKAYRVVAKKYHPDINPNDKEAEAKFGSQRSLRSVKRPAKDRLRPIRSCRVDPSA